jgi:hypothetical protein
MSVQDDFALRVRRCDTLRQGASGTNHNPVFPSKVGKFKRLGNEGESSGDISGNEDYDRKQPVETAED